MGRMHIIIRKRNLGDSMDMKIVITDGVGYVKHPIPPATYQIECIHMSDEAVKRRDTPLVRTRRSQITIDREPKALNCPAGTLKNPMAVMKKRIIEEPMTNLLYLALCCAKQQNCQDKTEREETRISNHFDELCPYLEQYIFAKRCGRLENYGMGIQEDLEDTPYYRFALEDYIPSEWNVRDAVLIIRDVHSNERKEIVP